MFLHPSWRRFSTRRMLLCVAMFGMFLGGLRVGLHIEDGTRVAEFERLTRLLDDARLTIRIERDQRNERSETRDREALAKPEADRASNLSS